MRNKLYKISTAILALAITFFFSGCGNHNIDDLLEDNSSSSGGSGSIPSVGSSSSVKSVSPPVASNCSLNGGKVTIGTQVWMSENLNCNVSGSKCYKDGPANCTKYGRLYDWATAMALPSNCNSSTCASQINAKHRGICPSGWHLPSDAEWTTLTNYVGGASTAGTKLKATSGWNSYSGVPAGTDTYGFAALPGGYGYSDGSFNDVGFDGYWWSATDNNDYFAYYRNLYYMNEYVYRNDHSKSYNFFSVRCVQD